MQTALTFSVSPLNPTTRPWYCPLFLNVFGLSCYPCMLIYGCCFGTQCSMLHGRGQLGWTGDQQREYILWLKLKMIILLRFYSCSTYLKLVMKDWFSPAPSHYWWQNKLFVLLLYNYGQQCCYDILTGLELIDIPCHHENKVAVARFIMTTYYTTQNNIECCFLLRRSYSR